MHSDMNLNMLLYPSGCRQDLWRLLSASSGPMIRCHIGKPMQVGSPVIQASGNMASLGTFQSQPLHADTFTDVLASVAAQWNPSDARQNDLQWTSQQV